MATRRDQLQSYQFLMQRVISSLVLHETDPEQAPLRRGVGAVFGGVMLTGLIAIAFGVYAVISGNVGDRWQQQGGIVIEKETGAHFLFENGTLVPVLNFTSARLLSGGEVQQVPGRNLADVPRTAPIGIPGAPDSLPPLERVVGAPWTLCSTLGQDAAGGPLTVTTLLLGEGTEDLAGAPLGERGMLVRDPDGGARYLIWRSHRFRLAGSDPDQIVRSLYGAQAQFVDTGTAWLEGLPAGPDLAPVDIPGLGEESPAVADFLVGDVVYHPVTGGEQHYLVLADGLAPVSPLQMTLLRGEYEVEPVEISAAAAGQAPASDALPPVTGEAAPPETPPDLLPVPASGPVTVCAETTDGRSPPALSLGGDLTLADGAIPTPGVSPEGARLADFILVPPGHVAVVRAIPSRTADTGSYHLVTDVGLRYAVPDEAVLGILGYPATAAVDIPSALVQRIPAGPTLDPAAARQPALS